MGITPEPERFFDPDPSLPAATPISIELKRVPGDGPEEWYVTRRIAYRDRRCEALGEPPIVVPRAPLDFKTDLTSVPQLFTWLVPRTGRHLPAALIHDALTPPFYGKDAQGDPLPDWEGPADIDQLTADRIFREAMADLGTPFLRRWMVWSAVSLPTAWKANRVQAALGYLGLFLIAVLGWLATLDLFDRGAWLPWMGDRPWWEELAAGAAMAVVIPLVLALVWPSGTRTAGAVTGVALACLLHVTIMVGTLTFAYQVAEQRLGVWAPPKRGLKILGTFAGLTVAGLTIWMVDKYGR